MAARLYVGNLPYSITEEELKDLFGQAGTVESVSLPTERDTGRPRGFGFVDMSTQSEAEEAIRLLDGHQMQNRALRVQEATERPPQQGGHKQAHGGERQPRY